MTDLTIGQRIAEERKKLGLSQEALGGKMGVSRQAISKWESDSAVPEIDKLIALSRLFGVRIGWLLGVEEPDAAQEDFTDGQLRILEELIRQSQPRPKKLWERLLMPGAVLILALFLCILSIRQNSHFSGQLRMESELGFARMDITQYVDDLSNLQGRVAALEAGVKHASANLLADYTFDADIQPQDPGVNITFSATPVTWAEGDVGWLSIRLAGEETQTIQCQWDGAFFSAVVYLDAADGYELCYTVVHADGTHEQQMLTDYYIEHLHTALTITVKADIGGASYDARKQLLTLQEVYTSYAMPAYGYEDQDRTVRWERLEYILVCGDRELGRHTLLSGGQGGDIATSPSASQYQREIRFENLPLTTEGGIQLWLYAELSNGLTAMEPASAWIFDASGNLEPQ